MYHTINITPNNLIQNYPRFNKVQAPHRVPHIPSDATQRGARAAGRLVISTSDVQSASRHSPPPSLSPSLPRLTPADTQLTATVSEIVFEFGFYLVPHQ